MYILFQIKNEYEKNLSFLRQKISELEPLRSMIVTINDKCELKIKQLKEAVGFGLIFYYVIVDKVIYKLVFHISGLYCFKNSKNDSAFDGKL